MPEPVSRRRLFVRGQIAAIDCVSGPDLAAALAALPGQLLRVDGLEWALRLGPDRAHSLSRIARAFDLECDVDSQRVLSELAGSRDLADPVIELVDGGEPHLSLLDDWHSLGVEALRSIPGARSQPLAGRTEIPLTALTASAVTEALEAHALRLSPPAELALLEALDPSAPPPSAPEGEDDIADELARIEMDDSGGLFVLSPGPDAQLQRAFAGIPKARAWGRSGRWTVTATPESAKAIRELAAQLSGVELSDPASRWLAEAARWIARIDIDASRDGGRIRIDTKWGEPPAELETLEGLGPDIRGLGAPLTPRNLSVIGELSDSQGEVTRSPAIERSRAWLTENPRAKSIPAAELRVEEERGLQRFVVEAIWNQELEDGFLHLEADVARRHDPSDIENSSVPAAAWPIDRLVRFTRSQGIAPDPEAERLIKSALKAHDDPDRLAALSRVRDADLEVEGLAGELMAFQRAGVLYALERRRVFIADEQGLGKTIQALATIQADHAFPAVVVCPASLKLNWVREAQRWLPGRSTHLIDGRSGSAPEDADIIVVNYEIVHAHPGSLLERNPRALILDESHYIKNPKARRTRAVVELAEQLSPDALRLALTGTPVVNRPAELAPQLRALDRLDEYGSATSFKHRYGTGFARRRLHERLRSSCYLRRRKDEVLDQLPAKRRAVVPVPLDNAAEYRRAERDFIHWLMEQIDSTGAGSLPDSARAVALVRLTALRRLAARGKVSAALEWIDSFAQSEERLVVFAHHRDIQDAVLERFPESGRIVGTDPIAEREANVQAFQAEDGPQLCVCSLEVASHGFTLTAAANVAFLELAWTPARHDQAEDRLHRIGQTQAVTAWYLLAADTIDERIATLLEAKRGVVDSLTDGGEETSSSLVAELIGGYAVEGDGGG